MSSCGLNDTGFATALRQPPRAERALWPALFCAWMLMVLTLGSPEDENLPAVVPDALLSNAKLVLRLSVLALMSLSLWKLWDQPRRPAVMASLSGLFLFVAWALLSVCWSPLRYLSFSQSFNLLTLTALGTVIALLWSGERSSSAVLQGLSLGCCSCSVVLLLIRVFIPAAEPMTRNHIGLLHATNSAATAALGLLLVFAARLIWDWPWTRRLVWPALLVHVPVLLISNNRLAVVLLVALSPLACFALRRTWPITVAVFVLCLAAVLYLAVDPGLSLLENSTLVVKQHAQREQSTEELSSLSGRHEMWGAMWSSLQESPLIGHGYFVTSSGGELYVWYEWGNWTAHNAFLQILVTTGLVGLSLFCLALLPLAFQLQAAARRNAIHRRNQVLLLTVAAWYFGWGLLNESVAGPLQPESVIFFCLLGLAAGAATSPVPGASTTARSAHRLPALITGAAS